MRYKLVVCCIMLNLLSCKTVEIENNTYKTTEQDVTIGAVAVDKALLFNKNHTTVALPIYSKPIKLSVALVPFSNKTYKAFAKANNRSTNMLAIQYIDSIMQKPKFVNMYVSDKVTLLNSLNAKENNDVTRYLNTQKEANIVSNISIALEEKNIKAITQADEFFIEQEGIKSYKLQCYKNGKKTEAIQFNKGVVFAYKSLSCCWKQNDKYQLEIVDLVKTINRCPNNSKKSARQAKKELNYFKL